VELIKRIYQEVATTVMTPVTNILLPIRAICGNNLPYPTHAVKRNLYRYLRYYGRYRIPVRFFFVFQ
jgi:hypothetical protein